MHPNRGYYGKCSLRFLHFCQSVPFLIKMGELELPGKCNICILVSEDNSSTLVNHHDEVHTTEESSQHNTEDLNEEDEYELDDIAIAPYYPFGIMGLLLFLLLISYLSIFFYRWILQNTSD